VVAPEHGVKFVLNQLRQLLITGVCSRGLVNELAQSFEEGTYNLFRILDEIAILEGSRPGPSDTKPAEMFRGPVLKGLWHKHHTQARFMPENLRLEMHRDGTVERVWKPYEGQVITQEMVSELVYALVKENYMNRAADGRLTGEWIVFARGAVGNQYLTLASHNEGDKQILDRVTTYQALDTLPKRATH